MNCSVCRNELQNGERVVYNHRETFVFKPANVPDVPMTRRVGDRVLPVPAAAVLSPQELLESRKEHTRTEVATSYILFGATEIPAMAFGVRHQDCVQRTGSGTGGAGVNKHSIRWQRGQAGRKMH